MDAHTQVKALSHWYLKHARRLPWRQTSDPYSIWISEVMLQQTQVTTVLPYYEKFLTLFPTIEALAKAELPSVLAAWSGLGYYSRARNLHRGAQYLVENFDGRFPTDREAILGVPGIGPYTAGAVLSIAYDLAVPLVDGNVQRVFARFFGERREIQLRPVQDFFWKTAEEWVKASNSPRVFNQALMELGATLCTKANPRCDFCPLQASCVSFKKGWQSELPRKRKRPDTVELYWMGLVYECKGQIYLKKNSSKEWWSDLWDLPRIELLKKNQAPERLNEALASMAHVHSWAELPRQKHTVTHHRIHVVPYRVRLKRRPLLEHPNGRWFRSDEVPALALSSLVRKVLASVEDA